MQNITAGIDKSKEWRHDILLLGRILPQQSKSHETI